MSSTKSDTLRVPGAQLAYEVRGSGPVLLLIHGGGGDARAFNGIARYLERRYTVVTYDRRGLSRSTPDDPEEEQHVEVHSDDAHHLLATVTSEPAYVFGSSGGAVVGLDLVARYSHQVRTLIAHEPPSHLVSGLEERHDSIRAIAHREGATSAMQQFMAQIGVTYDDRELDADLPEQGERPSQNTMFLLEREFAMYDRYRFDFTALRSASIQTRIVIAAGSSGRAYVGYQSAVAMAAKLGTAVVEFPGHHVGYVSHPKAFAAKLQEMLDETPLP
ncbi:alpha/beta hydrolase [Ktedonosporobacter rubrisoli]|uniref:Alpha/beta hydrolase n=1 Tax=Ktedonosporobacter rubrisoli TaxID=2509675 RepID=A0A4P6JY98_KTERU|nr:alpha/beta hydrolase [Ktedonosporobacter rubrisoli]QBD80452.1 alpha/beta hydrolase [Ktedonosporobacter rubrisoli]